MATRVLREGRAGLAMEARVCPGCNCLYRPRHAQEAERCWACAGLTIFEHVAASREATGEPVIAHRNGARPSTAPAPGTPDYLTQIDRLIGRHS